MKLLNQNQLKQLVLGSSLLATGGGGSLQSAKKLIKKINQPPTLTSLTELKTNDITATVFGIGGQEKCDPIKASNLALKTFKTNLNQPIKAIIPVEIGPLAIATAAFIASKTRLKLLDADIVGFRSSPEVFLETISIPNLPRHPSVIANDQNDILILLKTKDIQTTEKIFRDFAITSGGDAIVFGYPLTIKQIKNIVGANSLSFSLNLGKALLKLKQNQLTLDQFCQDFQFQQISQGKITSQKTRIQQGFTQGKLVIKTPNGNLSIIIKNENIAVIKNNQVLVTVPDLICLLDTNLFSGINNFDNNLNKTVAVLAKPAIPIWRTQKGKALFSPKNLGYNFKQKLL